MASFYASTWTTTNTFPPVGTASGFVQVSGSSWGSAHETSNPQSLETKKPVDVQPQNLYKTELCRSFDETGNCRYGSKCQFAHGQEELRHVPRHPKYKTEVCKTFSSTGACPYGKRCRFIHSMASSTKPSQSKVETQNMSPFSTSWEPFQSPFVPPQQVEYSTFSKVQYSPQTTTVAFDTQNDDSFELVTPLPFGVGNFSQPEFPKTPKRLSFFESLAQ